MHMQWDVAYRRRLQRKLNGQAKAIRALATSKCAVEKNYSLINRLVFIYSRMPLPGIETACKRRAKFTDEAMI